MSQHFVERSGLPPGLTSFTKIRLGWIGKEQVSFVKRGETATALLSPLSAGGERLAVKVFLSRGKYYLIENRQPVGFDRALPDSGILILKVDPDAQEGSGTVRVMDANPAAPHFSQATFRAELKGRNLFKDDDIAVIPLWQENDRTGVIITTPDKSAEVLDAVRAVIVLEKQKGPEDPLTAQAKAAFLAADYKRCMELLNTEGN
jgi:hypothetical protein